MQRSLVIATILSLLVFHVGAFGINPLIKWSQLPDVDTGSGHISQWGYDGWYPSTVRADDWECTSAAPVAKVRWWGSNLGNNDIGDPDGFNIKIFTNDDTGSHSQPGALLYNQFISFLDISTIDTGQTDMMDNSVFKYEADLEDLGIAFDQQGAPGQPVVYWLSIVAISGDVPPLWGWEKALTDNLSYAAVNYLVENPLDDFRPDIGCDNWGQEQNDLAFEMEMVPEPGIGFMMSGGLAGLLFLVRRRRK